MNIYKYFVLISLILKIPNHFISAAEYSSSEFDIHAFLQSLPSEPHGFLEYASDMDIKKIVHQNSILKNSYYDTMNRFLFLLKEEQLQTYLRGDTEAVFFLKSIQKEYASHYPDFFEKKHLKIKSFTKYLVQMFYEPGYEKMFHAYQTIKRDLQERKFEDIENTVSKIFILYWIGPKLLDAKNSDLTKNFLKSFHEDDKQYKRSLVFKKAFIQRLDNPYLK